MKKSVLLTMLFSLSLTTYLHADPDSYDKAMRQAITELDSARTQEEFQTVANTFDRIAIAEPGEWLPLYYSGLSYIYMSFDKSLAPEQRDQYLDKALEKVNAANKLNENNVEITILMGYLKMARLTVNPAERGPSMSPQVSAYFQKAVSMDPQNPRALILLARWKYGTARYFNSSIEESCAMVAKSIPLFKSQDAGALTPHWGLDIALDMEKACVQEN